jgi:5-oxoprolinase (ATP-hydrolysing) subunit A
VDTEEVDGFVDLNADVGEVDDPAELETALLEIVTSANIATGAHAGNPAVMSAAVRSAADNGVRVGAHPSYPDRAGFGRRAFQMSPEALRAELLAQVGALDAIARDQGQSLLHVKPHGALYHRANSDEDCARLLAEVVGRFDGAALVAPAGSETFSSASSGAAGIPILFEAFCDRGYRPDGRLVARGEDGDLVTDPRRAGEQAVSIATRGQVRAVDGSWLNLRADTICLHGDTPGAAQIGIAVREALERAGVVIRAPLR